MANYSKNHDDIVKQFKSGLKDKHNVPLVDPQNNVNEKAIKTALELAFPDITPRTMTRKKLKPEDEALAFDKMPEELLKYSETNGQNFLEQIQAWFEKEPIRKNDESEIDAEAWCKEFNAFHHKACNTVKAFLKGHYKDKSCTYGKAQKVVNMTFKHLYCLEDAVKKEDHFIPCHIALDSFTLEWFKRNVIPWCASSYNEWIKQLQSDIENSNVGKACLAQKDGRKWNSTVLKKQLPKQTKDALEQLVGELREKRSVPGATKPDKAEEKEHKLHAELTKIPETYLTEIKNEELQKIQKGHFPAKLDGSGMVSWSVIPEEGSNKFSYDQYVRWIRIYFDTNETYGELTPFQAEFYIWPEIQLELAAEALFGQDIGKEDSMAYLDQYMVPHSRTFQKQEADFSKYNEMFRKLPLGTKLRFLKPRLEQLCNGSFAQNHSLPSATAPEGFPVKFPRTDGVDDAKNKFETGCSIFFSVETKNQPTVEEMIKHFRDNKNVLCHTQGQKYFYLVLAGTESEDIKKADELVENLKSKDYIDRIWCLEGTGANGLATCYEKKIAADAIAWLYKAQLEEKGQNLVLSVSPLMDASADKG